MTRQQPPSTSRSWGWTFLALACLLALAVLTWRQATSSPALDRARTLEARGSYPTAAQEAMRHLASRPWSRQASLIAARCLSRMDWAQLAEPYYRRAGRLTAEDEHHRIYGLLRANDRERVIQLYKDRLERDPADVTASERLAGVYLTRGEWRKVEEIAEGLIARPDGPVTTLQPVSTTQGKWRLQSTKRPSVALIGYALLALALTDEGELMQALPIYEKIAALDPNLEKTPLSPELFWSHYGVVLTRLGKAAEAVAVLSRAVVGRSDPGLLELLGEAYEQSSDLAGSERCLLQILDLDPRHVNALLKLGRLRLQQSRPKEALELLDRALEVHPGNRRALYFSLSRAHQMLGHDDEAKRYRDLFNAASAGDDHDTPGMGAPVMEPAP